MKMPGVVKETIGDLDLEAYPNRDSMPYQELYGLDDARTMFMGTLRYPGWSVMMRNLVKIGFLAEDVHDELSGKSYRDLTAALAGVPGEDLGPPPGERLDQGAQLGARVRVAAPVDRPIERGFGVHEGVGEVAPQRRRAAVAVGLEDRDQSPVRPAGPERRDHSRPRKGRSQAGRPFLLRPPCGRSRHEIRPRAGTIIGGRWPTPVRVASWWAGRRIVLARGR